MFNTLQLSSEYLYYVPFRILSSAKKVFFFQKKSLFEYYKVRVFERDYSNIINVNFFQLPANDFCLYFTNGLTFMRHKTFNRSLAQHQYFIPPHRNRRRVDLYGHYNTSHTKDYQQRLSQMYLQFPYYIVSSWVYKAYGIPKLNVISIFRIENRLVMLSLRNPRLVVISVI